ncbi:ER degradation-enhancing alpha-mannosidase-like protein 2 [Mya arenaria]|uniref:ER degradation-enhancing alpha-mannosidase-like protein 2 n=1 Tax=Mya arenaria TaxID=6604 RepID=UPI0022E8913E|nr:ER degradation-enhancing alpha-mannosidase-like protein 2 [Mya arenaria]
MAAPIIRVIVVLICLKITTYECKVITSSDMIHYRKKVEEMFHHAYDGYIQYAYPYDELRPLSCDGHDTWGSYSLTLIDALDMLVIMGNNTEFQRVANLVIENMNFDNDINVSVFETNIRVVGGLLSAHLMSKRGGLTLEPGWPCSGPLLRLAEDVARRLLPAFDTATGMPYGTVNLKYGVPKGETTVTCTAGVGTFIVEFGALSRLTGDPIFEKVAMRAMKSLWRARSSIGLVGNHIDVASGKWTALDAGVGGGIDSYFEYLVKGSVMLSNTELLDQFYEYLESVEQYLKKDDWYMWAHMTKGTVSLPIFTSLDCYWPGIQAMLGDVDKAMKTMHNFHQVWKQYGFLPEFYNIVKNEPHAGREGYPLRPELVEAAMYLYQATRDPFLLQLGVDMLTSIEQITRTKCGYATVKDVTDHTLENRMESFFLAETVKYLYLLFDEDNFIHNSGDHGTIIQTPNGQCVVDTGSYIFNTEAHPIDTAALYCCSAEKKEHDLELQDFHDNLDLLTLFNLNDNTDTIEGVRWSTYKKRNDTLTDMQQNLESLSEQIKKYQVKTEGDHQRIMSTKGEKFTVNQRQSSSTKVVTINGKHIKGMKAIQEQNPQAGSELSGVVSPPETKPLQQVQDPENDRFDDQENEEDQSQDQESIENNVDSNANSEFTVTPAESLAAVNNDVKFHSIKYETPFKKTESKITDVLKLIKSFTEDYLANSGVKSVKTLHEKLQYYSLFHHEKPERLMCEAQPFYTRFSLMGEMFLSDKY